MKSNEILPAFNRRRVAFGCVAARRNTENCLKERRCRDHRKGRFLCRSWKHKKSYMDRCPKITITRFITYCQADLFSINKKTCQIFNRHVGFPSVVPFQNSSSECPSNFLLPIYVFLDVFSGTRILSTSFEKSRGKFHMFVKLAGSPANRSGRPRTFVCSPSLATGLTRVLRLVKTKRSGKFYCLCFTGKMEDDNLDVSGFALAELGLFSCQFGQAGRLSTQVRMENPCSKGLRRLRFQPVCEYDALI